MEFSIKKIQKGEPWYVGDHCNTADSFMGAWAFIVNINRRLHSRAAGTRDHHHLGSSHSG
jgi:hypothetical protein